MAERTYPQIDGLWACSGPLPYNTLFKAFCMNPASARTIENMHAESPGVCMPI